MLAPDRPRVLVVDDRLELAETLADGLGERGYAATPLSSSRAALARLEGGAVDALVTDLRMPDGDGLALLAASRRLVPERPVIVMTAYGAIDSAIESIRLGASHYLTKPFKLEELAIYLDRALDEVAVRREAAALKSQLARSRASSAFVGGGKAARELLEAADRIAHTDARVLITGETGTGKGLVAQLLHAASPRAKAPFVTVNCAALPEALLESELFGHVRGAFTGATRDRNGLFAEADGGTLLLDEIGELPLALQAKLLQVLESGTVRPVGASKERPIDVRVLSATHVNLRERVAEGRFREDLLYRLDVVPLALPPLRARREDLPELIEHFLGVARARHPTATVQRLSPAAMASLLDHAWPGNVRELAHLLERLVLLSRGPEVDVAELPETVRGDVGAHGVVLTDEIVPVREMQRRYAAWALKKCDGHRGRTAQALGIDMKTLAKWL